MSPRRDNITLSIEAALKGVMIMTVGNFFSTTQDDLDTPVRPFIQACIVGHINRLAAIASQNAHITKGGMFQLVLGVNIHWKLVENPTAEHPIEMWLEVTEEDVSPDLLDKLAHILWFNNVLK